MAINPGNLYVGQITAPSAEYPFGKARNVTTPGDGLGTPWELNNLNDIFGFHQSMLDDAGVTPSGNAEEVGASQYYDSLRKKVSVYANVKAFGAKGDAVTDDTLAIQAAIDFVSGGGGVFFPPGNYVTDKLIVGSDISLIGIGGELTLKTGSDAPIIEIPVSSERVLLHKLKLNGNASNNAGTVSTDGLIKLASTSGSPVKNIHINQCFILDSHQHGIFLADGCEHVKIVECVINTTTLGAGIQTKATCTDITISENSILATKSDGINCETFINSRIIGNDVDGSSGLAGKDNINVESKDNVNVIVNDNTLHNSADHGITGGGFQLVISDNVIEGHTVTGIVILATGAANASSPNCSISGNSIVGSASSVDGIFAQNVPNVSMNGNVIKDGSSAGIQVVNTGLIDTANIFSLVGNIINLFDTALILINGGAGIKKGTISGNTGIGSGVGVTTNGVSLIAVEEVAVGTNSISECANGIIESGASNFNAVVGNVARGNTTPITTVGGGTISGNNVV